MSNDVPTDVTRPERRRHRVLPISGDVSRHIFAKRPRCKRCGSAELKTYKSLPRDGDSIVRYVNCDVCGNDYILVLD
jgi:hypothetical protein